jgi:cytochrome c oxidase subunit 2
VSGPRCRRRRWRAGLLLLLIPLLTSCNGAKWVRGGWPAPVTVQGHRILILWQGALIAALAVGALIWGLIIFACIRFRRRSDELPRQVRYNVPIELLYTMVPIVIVAFLFFFTVKDENYEDKLPKHPDLYVGVVGFQWSWQFNYPKPYDLQITGSTGHPPTLVLPIDKSITFVLTSPDVIHTFWVVPFLFKRQVIPGRVNEFNVTIDKTGYFWVRCAQYCGTYHYEMTAHVRAVTWTQFLAFIKHARALAASSHPGQFSLIGGSST